MAWLNCGVTAQVDWPKDRKEVTYGNRTFVFLPRTAENSASIHIKLEGITNVEGLTLINRLLSALTLKCDEPAINHYG